MKEEKFHTISNKLQGLLTIYKEAYPSATVSRTYENSIYQRLRNEIQFISNLLAEEVNGRGPRRARGIEDQISISEEALRELQDIPDLSVSLPPMAQRIERTADGRIFYRLSADQTLPRRRNTHADDPE